MSAAAYCRELTARSRSNFYYAFLFLPEHRRQALEGVYSFCRLVDDVVDSDAPAGEKYAGLARWRAEVAAVYGGTPSHPVSAKLAQAIRWFPIRREDLEAVIDGCAMDVEKQRYASWDELRTYCYRVASAVGLMCIEIFGCASDKARNYAVDLGIALQLTNILRDVGEDAARGRVYLPAEDLAAFGVDESDLRAGRRTPGFERLMRFQAGRARAHYLRARASLGEPERRRLYIAEIMGDIYFALLERIESSGFDVFGHKSSLSSSLKMGIALKKFAQAQLGALTHVEF